MRGIALSGPRVLLLSLRPQCLFPDLRGLVNMRNITLRQEEGRLALVSLTKSQESLRGKKGGATEDVVPLS